jgi:hypothetical protein
MVDILLHCIFFHPLCSLCSHSVLLVFVRSWPGLRFLNTFHQHQRYCSEVYLLCKEVEGKRLTCLLHLLPFHHAHLRRRNGRRLHYYCDVRISSTKVPACFSRKSTRAPSCGMRSYPSSRICTRPKLCLLRTNRLPCCKNWALMGYPASSRSGSYCGQWMV